jgi:hypothetical protein
VFNATFSNISAISWRPVLLVEETGVPGENHRPWATTAYLNLKNKESIFFFFISLTNIQNVKNNLGKFEKQFYVYMKGSVTNVKKN